MRWLISYSSCRSASYLRLLMYQIRDLILNDLFYIAVKRGGKINIQISRYHEKGVRILFMYSKI